MISSIHSASGNPTTGVGLPDFIEGDTGAISQKNYFEIQNFPDRDSVASFLPVITTAMLIK